MSDVSFLRDERDMTVRMNVRGHAGYDCVGRDIVCAAVSVLAFTAANLASRYEEAGAEVYVRISDGDVCVEVRCEARDLYERCVNQMNVVELGFALLAAEYPQYIKLTSGEISGVI